MKAVVKNGRLVMDEPTSLPEGTELELVVADGGDDMDEEERARLLASLHRSIDQARAGQVFDARQVVEEMRRKHSR